MKLQKMYVSLKNALITRISIGFLAKRIEILMENAFFPIFLRTFVQEFPKKMEKMHYFKGFQ